MPARLDVVLVLLLAAVSVLEQVYFWPRFRADSDAGRPRTRPRAYRTVILGEWLFALAAIAIWTGYRRSWPALSLSVPQGWRLALGVVVNCVVLALLLLQLKSVARLSVARRVATRSKIVSVAFMLPRTREEQLWFLTLAMTAGFCEELLFRGYLPWLLTPWLGSIGSMGLAVVLFGFGHAYQGGRGTVKVMMTGALMAAVVLATHSLIPAMVLHALIDFEGATVGYLFMRDYPSAGASSMSAAQGAHEVADSVMAK